MFLQQTKGSNKLCLLANFSVDQKLDWIIISNLENTIFGSEIHSQKPMGDETDAKCFLHFLLYTDLVLNASLPVKLKLIIDWDFFECKHCLD